MAKVERERETERKEEMIKRRWNKRGSWGRRCLVARPAVWGPVESGSRFV